MKTARVFRSGNSQAVRLPKEFQLKEKELSIVLKDGALILRPIRKTWREYFERVSKGAGFENRELAGEQE